MAHYHYPHLSYLLRSLSLFVHLTHNPINKTRPRKAQTFSFFFSIKFLTSRIRVLNLGQPFLRSSEMDPPLVNDSSFSAANPSSYTLSEIWPFPVNDAVRSGLRLAVNSGRVFTRSEHSGNKDVSAAEESTVTDLTAGWGSRKTRDLNSEDDSSKMVSSSSSGNELVRFCTSIFEKS